MKNASTHSPRRTTGCGYRLRRAFALVASALIAFSPGAILTSPKTLAAAPETEAVAPKVRDAVDKALAWLKQNQQPDGSWAHGGVSTTTVPSLAVMSFLARGHVPGQGPYGQMLYKSIDLVLASQKEDGTLSASPGTAMMYEHGISTVMLSEVYGMVDDEHRTKIDRALAKSVKLILDAQKVTKPPPFQGGWRYTPLAADSDLSCTGWQLMALRGAANCGAAVPRGALDAGLDYVKRSAAPGGGFGYQPGGAANIPRTGTGILAMELLGQHHTPQALAGGDYLIANPPTNPAGEFYYYAIYYCSQSLNQLGGKYWETIYPKLVEALLAQQQPAGTWPGGAGEEAAAGDAYRTSMACLALCVPFRCLPLYQK